MVHVINEKTENINYFYKLVISEKFFNPTIIPFYKAVRHYIYICSRMRQFTSDYKLKYKTCWDKCYFPEILN